jgi:hypothetical protein
MSDCQHREINAWFFEDGEAAGMYSCASCGVKFVPITELMTAENELAAAKADIRKLEELYRGASEREIRYAQKGHRLQEALVWITDCATIGDAEEVARAALAKENAS